MDAGPVGGLRTGAHSGRRRGYAHGRTGRPAGKGRPSYRVELENITILPQYATAYYDDIYPATGEESAPVEDNCKYSTILKSILYFILYIKCTGTYFRLAGISQRSHPLTER